MGKGKNYFAGPKGKQWQVKGEGNDRASAVYDTQEEAWADAKSRAKGAESEALLQGRDGKIRERNTYGKDPYPPKG